MDNAIRLNIGAGEKNIDGWMPIDRKRGSEAYPLAYDDGTVDEIRASHVLEHFGHRQVSDVINHWVRKLKPGGRLAIAVPDFAYIAAQYNGGDPIDVLRYTMGGQTDENDWHGTIFDREALTEVMMNAGLERISRWDSEIADCASLPVSLNLQGWKPISSERSAAGVAAVLSAPRFGPVMHSRCAFEALGKLKIPCTIGQGAYWHQVLSEQIEQLLADGWEYILTLDYDTVFTADDVLELRRLLVARPDVDAVCALQMKRGSQHPLFSVADADGKTRRTIPAIELTRNLLPVCTGHFGLTMFRADSLRRFSRPWMVPAPSPDGRWGNGKTDADIDFWQRFARAGFSLELAPKVVIGHLEETIVWPSRALTPIHQSPSEYVNEGMPSEVWQ